MTSSFIFRFAHADENEFLALSVLDAVGMHEFNSEIERELLDAISEECKREDSLYSYRHSVVLEKDGKVVGCVMSYPGDIYPQLRKETWKRINDAMGDSSADASDNETCPGEYYIDTLAVLSEFRGYGYGRLLLEEAVSRAQLKGYDRITLIAEQDHPRLLAYYESCGFVIESELTFLGEKYYKMIYGNKI